MAHIARLSARPLDVRLNKPFGIAGGAQHEAKNVLVSLELDDKMVGYGEGAPFAAFNGETQERVLAAIGVAAPLIEGCDLHATETIRERVRETCESCPSALCAIETAILDMRARRSDQSITTLLGGAEQELITDITITTGTVDEAVRDARVFSAFRTLKVKVGGRDVDHDVARVLAIRAARPEAHILIDANGGFSVDEAVRFAAEIKSATIQLFEQPIPPGNWEALAEVRRRTGLTIAVDESVTCANDVTEAARHRATDAVNVKIMKSGVFEALAIIACAKEEGLIRMIGGLVETRLAMGTSACIAAGIGGFTFIDLDTPLFLADDPFVGGYTQEGDRIDVSPITLGHGTKPRG